MQIKIYTRTDIHKHIYTYIHMSYKISKKT